MYAAKKPKTNTPAYMRKSVNIDAVGSISTPPSWNYFNYLNYILTGDLTQGVSYVLEDVTNRS